MEHQQNNPLQEVSMEVENFEQISYPPSICLIKNLSSDALGLILDRFDLKEVYLLSKTSKCYYANKFYFLKSVIDYNGEFSKKWKRGWIRTLFSYLQDGISSSEPLKFEAFRYREDILALSYIKDLGIPSLKLSNHCQDWGPTVFEGLLIALRDNSSLMTLNLWGQDYIKDRFVQFLNVIEKNTSLTDLRIEGSCFLNDENASLFARSLSSNSTLRTLNLRGSAIKEKGVIELATVLSKNITLTSLNLGWNHINDAGWRALGTLIEENQTIIKLELQKNDTINSAKIGLSYFLESLRQNKSITHLNLKDTKLGVSDLQLLASYLCGTEKLVYLDLASTEIGDVGVCLLSEALAINKSLTYLDLTFNNISNDGAIKISCVLKLNTPLSIIVLDYNKIGDFGAEVLLKGVIKSTILQNIFFYKNIVSYEKQKYIKQMDDRFNFSEI